MPVVWTAFIVAAIAALVLTPILSGRQVERYHVELRDVIEPARALSSTIKLSIAQETAALHEFLEMESTEQRTAYYEALAAERAAVAALGPLAERLGPSVAMRLDSLRDAEERWHSWIERLLARQPEELQAADLLAGDRFERVLLAAARLDEAITVVSRDRRQQLIAVEARQRRFTGFLGLIAIAAMVAVGSLGERLRRYASEGEDRRRELERLMEGRARLTRGISHDLKNPINAIDGHAQLLEDGIKGALTPDQQDSVVRIRRAVQSLLKLINDIVELSRTESGRLEVAHRPTNVGDVVQEVSEEHRAEAEASNLDFRVEVDDHLPTIDTDPERVRQIVSNLLSNAVKYTPAGGHVVVRAVLDERTSPRQRGRWIGVHVIDDGPGIPPEELDDIFLEFHRVGATQHHQGSGLGLAIAQRIAGFLGGSISVTSEPGKGSTFTLWLPARRAAD
jgi:signal transduction histidine kinase